MRRLPLLTMFSAMVAAVACGGRIACPRRADGGVDDGTQDAARLRHEESGAVATPQLLPVVVESHGPTPRLLEIAIADVRVRVEVGSDLAYVAALVGALRSGCVSVQPTAIADA